MINNVNYDNWVNVASDKGRYGIFDTAITIAYDKSASASVKKLALQRLNDYDSLVNPNALTKAWFFITGNSKVLRAFQNFKYSYDKAGPVGQIEVTSSKDAISVFMLNFEEIFHRKPNRMSSQEKVLVEEISKRIWESPQVQNTPDKYDTYKNFMIQFYSGAHFNFEESDHDDILNQLKEKIGFNEDKTDLGKNHLAARVSSHFVKYIGEVDHVHLVGKQIPEAVMSEVTLCKDAHGILHPGIRSDIYEESLSDDEKKKITHKKYFWIQTENNPDGPDWTSYLKHRTIDFTIYTLRKLLRFENVNVGPYGYGRGDRDPIIIQAPQR